MPEAQPGQEQRMEVRPIAEMSCDRCGKLIDARPGETYTASTDGRVWHYGCKPIPPAPTRPTADLGDDGELIRRLRAPAYWMSGSSDGHEGENYAPLEAADRLILYREAAKYAHATLVELKIARTLSEGGVGGAATAVSGVVNKLRAVLSRSGG